MLASRALAVLGLACAYSPTAAAPPGFDKDPKELNLTGWQNKRILLIGAHPDDIGS